MCGTRYAPGALGGRAGGDAVGGDGGEALAKLCQQAFLDADVVRLRGATLGGPACLRAGLAQKERRSGIERKEVAHAVGVVVVCMRKHGKVYLGKVDTQRVGVLREGIRLPKVQQDAQLPEGKVQRETMLCAHALRRGVLDEGGNAKARVHDAPCDGVLRAQQIS